VLLADHNGELEGCIALREVNADICEMKRLYVRPQARGKNIGRQLAERLIAEARGIGYKEMRLDVQENSASARRLYGALGLVPAGPLAFDPRPGASLAGRDV